MDRDTVIALARKAGAMFDHMTWVERDLAPVFERFAALVAAHEREAIWNIVFDYAGRDDLSDVEQSLLKHLADLIRSRTNPVK